MAVVFKNLNFVDSIEAVFFVVSFLFMIFSFLGWILELFFRRFVTSKKWINPGFLKGPYLPIYGFGIVFLFVYVSLIELIEINNQFLFYSIIILGIGLIMTLIELIGGLIFIHGMNIRLWDYSDRKWNYKGIICPLFSIIWMVAGACFYFFLYNPILSLVERFVTMKSFDIAVFFMGVFYGIFIIDFIVSMGIGLKLKKLASEKQIILLLENFKSKIVDDLKLEKIKTKFLSPLKTPHSLEIHLHNIKGSIKIFEKKRIKRKKNKNEDHKNNI